MGERVSPSVRQVSREVGREGGERPQPVQGSGAGCGWVGLPQPLSVSISVAPQGPMLLLCHLE